MADKLQMYNNALTQHVGERPLGSLTEQCKARRLLDKAWDSGIVRSMLEKGYWNFATKSAQGYASQSVTPPYGLKCAFDKPSDWVKTSAICMDPFMRVPILDYKDENGYWYLNQDTAYFSWISDDVDYGMNLALWPDSFENVIVTGLAAAVVIPLTHDKNLKADIDEAHRKALVSAKSSDAMNSPPAFPPLGSWARSRFGNNAGGRPRSGIRNP